MLIAINWLFIGLGFCIGACVCAIPLFSAMRRKAELQSELAAIQSDTAKLQDRFSVLAQDVLNNSNDRFLALAGERFDQRQNLLGEMIKPVETQMNALRESVGNLSGLNVHLKQELTTLSAETNKLAAALRNPVARGAMGEALLQRLLDMSGLLRDVHYHVQTSVAHADGLHRPDVTLTLGGSMTVYIDAKAPYGEILDMLGDPDQQDTVAQLAATKVKDHVKALGKKSYWKASDNGPDFTVLFLPTDLLYGLAMGRDPQLLELAAENRIVICSPMLLLGLLRALAMLARQSDATNHATELLAVAGSLQQNLVDLFTDWGKVGKQLDTVTKTYNASLKTLERKIMPLAGKIEDMQAVPVANRLSMPDSISEQINPLKEAS